MFQKTNKVCYSHVQRGPRSSKNGCRAEVKDPQPVTETAGSYVKLANWIFTQRWEKYESGLCHWTANFREIWLKGIFFAFALMLTMGGKRQTLVLISLWYSLSLRDSSWRTPKRKINRSQCTETLKVLPNLACLWHQEVNVCFGVCHLKLYDSPWLWRTAL